VGVTLPSFRHDATAALDGAARVEALGLDGAFVFDHLWPLGRRDRPALSAFPLLGALAAATRRVTLGSLVARVGLVPDAVLVAELASLAHLAPGRLIAGLGTGDHDSAAENVAYGVPPDPPEARRRALARCGRTLLALGVPVWVGGGSPATDEIAFELGEGAALNLWGATPAALSGFASRGEVTWAGPLAGGVTEMARRLAGVAATGATWAVCAWPASLEALAEAARSVREG